MAEFFDIKVDPVTCDIIIKNNDVVTIFDQEVIVQNVVVTLRMFSGGNDWPFDPSLGVPWFRDKLTGENILGNSDLEQVESILKREIIAVDGVEELLEFDTAYVATTRVFTVDFKFRTKFGVSSRQSINL